MTTTIYDATGTYPATTTNAKNQRQQPITTSAREPPLNHRPEYLHHHHEYDGFGRIKKEIKPSDTTTHPTTLYQDSVYGTAPEGTLIAKREVSGQRVRLMCIPGVMGLGRKLQVRAEAEQTTKQIVTNSFYSSSQRRNHKRNRTSFGCGQCVLWNTAGGDQSH